MAKSFSEITFKYKTNFINRVSLFVSIFLISIIGLSILSLLNSGFKSEDAFLTIEDIFQVVGVGLVISGTVNSGKIIKGERYMLGQFNGMFYEVMIK